MYVDINREFVEDGLEHLAAAVVKTASIDYIKAKRLHIRGLITDKELKLEQQIYSKCIDNWVPYTYDIINPEYMITVCDKIAYGNKNHKKKKEERKLR